MSHVLGGRPGFAWQAETKWSIKIRISLATENRTVLYN